MIQLPESLLSRVTRLTKEGQVLSGILVELDKGYSYPNVTSTDLHPIGLELLGSGWHTRLQ